MTLNCVMAVAMRYFTEFGSSSGALRKTGCRYTDTFCGRIFIAIFAKVTENECIIRGRMWPASVIKISLTHCYFPFQLQVWFSHDEMFVNFRWHFLLKCCYFVTKFSKPVPTHNRVDLWRNLCTSLLYFVLCVRCRRKKDYRIGPPSSP